MTIELHPLVTHHLVNSLGWPSLRPVQEMALGPVMAGEDILVIAPTAGGKTEAVLFPLLSRAVEERWTGLGILYVCPIKALLNNLEPRARTYMGFAGRRAAVWHGDVGAPARRKLLADPPDLLLTTPESIEAMLIGTRVEHERFFADVRAIVVDELHAFAGDDRGWHLLAVLERLQRICGRRIQRLGLSATVGDPTSLATWFAGAGRPPATIVVPPVGQVVAPEIVLDYVGSLANAAMVIASLHAGEKRLVFCDSRSVVEDLGRELRERQVETYVSHGSLGIDERRRAESAFAEGSNCVIVATSTLELGLDVGDLDRVIQIDAPTSVASFLQRMGRTGRRAGTARNCTFLATQPDALVRAAGLLRLWASGYVEPVQPPAAPWHLYAQQLMALVLQEKGVDSGSWTRWVEGVPAFASAPPGLAAGIEKFMLDEGILASDQGLLGMGPAGEEHFGARHFMDLVAAFTTPPLFLIRHGRAELGWVHHSSFISRDGRPPVIVLGGRAWAVGEIDWPARVAWVSPTEDEGRSRWRGSSLALRGELCRAMRAAIVSEPAETWWSRRALDEHAAIRAEFRWLQPDATTLQADGDGARATWWTFAGMHANRMMAAGLADLGIEVKSMDNSAIHMRLPADGHDVIRAAISSMDASLLVVPVPDAAIQDLKFQEALPADLAGEVLATRWRDEGSARLALAENLHVVVGLGSPQWRTRVPTPWLPEAFSAQIGGFMGPSFRVALVDSGLRYTPFDHGYRELPSMMISPSEDAWIQFWKEVDGLEIWAWNPSYQPEVQICDGTSWCVTLEREGKVLQSGGSNAGPSTLGGFCAAVSKLAGGLTFA